MLYIYCTYEFLAALYFNLRKSRNVPSRINPILLHIFQLAAASFINVSSDTSLIEGSVLQLFCNASGRPAPNITWVRITSSGSESNVLHRGTTWEFENVSRTEAGTYRCIAYNGVGNSVSHTLRVNVECEYI